MSGEETSSSLTRKNLLDEPGNLKNAVEGIERLLRTLTLNGKLWRWKDSSICRFEHSFSYLEQFEVFGHSLALAVVRAVINRSMYSVSTCTVSYCALLRTP